MEKRRKEVLAEGEGREGKLQRCNSQNQGKRCTNSSAGGGCKEDTQETATHSPARPKEGETRWKEGHRDERIACAAFSVRLPRPGSHGLCLRAS